MGFYTNCKWNQLQMKPIANESLVRPQLRKRKSAKTCAFGKLRLNISACPLNGGSEIMAPQKQGSLFKPRLARNKIWKCVFPHHPRGDGSVFNRWVVRARARVRACVPSALSAIYSCGNFSKVDFKIARRRRPKKIVRGDSRLKGNMYYDDFPETRRRYTNFPDIHKYIVSELPGRPKKIVARSSPGASLASTPPHEIEKSAKF